MVADAFHPRTQEAEAEAIYLCLQSEFKDSHEYTEKPYLKTENKTKKEFNYQFLSQKWTVRNKEIERQMEYF